MNTRTYLSVIAGALLTTTLASADPPMDGDAEAAQAQARQEAFAEHKAYLGVTVSPVDPALGAQLALPEGVGLVVEYVDPNSPAAKVGLKQHDVLHKLDEQLLINPAQIKVLVRLHEPGATVTLHLLRQAKAESVTVTLAGRRPVQVAQAGALVAGRPATQISRIGYRDGTHRLVLTGDAAGRRLRATDAAGNLVYDGYINDEAARAAVPLEVRKKFAKFERLLKRQMPDKAAALQAARGTPTPQGPTEEETPADGGGPLPQTD